MKPLTIGLIFILILLALSHPRWSQNSRTETLPEVAGVKTDVQQREVTLAADSSFQETDEIIEEKIPFKTEFQDDDEKELGYQEVITKGETGKKILTYRTTVWEGEEIGKELIKEEVIDPINETIVKGTKTIIRSMDAPDFGKIDYKEKLTVWATSYDGNCYGCSGRTATGKAVTHGICATDPSVIPLGTAFYVPGYGMCSAQDTGGAIKGNKIDVGFEDVRQGWWSSRYTDIYILP